VKIGPAVRPGRRIEKKKVRTRQDSQKKSQGGNISPIWGEAPTVPIESKICMAGNLADVITCAKFQDEIFRSYDFTGGRISHFPIDFCMGLTTVQRDCAACDSVHNTYTDVVRNYYYNQCYDDDNNNNIYFYYY